MSTAIYSTQRNHYVGVVMLSMVLAFLPLGSLASGTAAPGPGTPDELQLQHYEQFLNAMDKEDRVSALAALALFEADIFRWHTNTMNQMIALTELIRLTDAVDDEEWQTAKKLVRDLKNKYRPD